MISLAGLERFSPITIQCHNNPDADSIGAGFGLYRYFKQKEKEVRLIYSGNYQIHKSNLLLLLEKLEIPIEYVSEREVMLPPEGLLIMVDCQYGEGNAVRFMSNHVAVIDHHEIEGLEMEYRHVEFSEIRPDVGSCCTLVWRLLKRAGYLLEADRILGTALYYGLLMDTRQFEELENPLDRDMLDSICYDKELVSLFRYSNLSLKELEIAGIALLRYTFNEKYHYAVIKAQPCDPNILGIISDFLIQVASVDTCLVYNEQADGFKISVRSCVKQVRANEFISYITKRIGSGGGHGEKAGGFIKRRRYERAHPTLHSEAFFSQKINEYFDVTKILHADEYKLDKKEMKRFRKKEVCLGFVRTADILPEGNIITVRTQEKDMDITVCPDLYLMIEENGKVFPKSKEAFRQAYKKTEGSFRMESDRESYVPTIVPAICSEKQPEPVLLAKYAHPCVSLEEVYVYAKKLTDRTKVFESAEGDNYRVGEAGDYLAVEAGPFCNVTVIEKGEFEALFEEA